MTSDNVGVGLGTVIGSGNLSADTAVSPLASVPWILPVSSDRGQ